MSLLGFLFLALPLAAPAEPARLLDCRYNFMSVPFTEVQLGFSETGPEVFVTIVMQGSKRRESFTPEEATPEMLLHGWISKESPENSIEMIVYKEPRKTGRSVLINPHIPVGKEMWGDCSFR